MATATNYQCPACGGPLHFSGTTQKLECDYCGGKYNIDEMNKMYSDKVREEAEKNAAYNMLLMLAEGKNKNKQKK